MKEQIKKFLKFNGKTIYYLDKDGEYWIAIRSLCDALNIGYTPQYKAVKRHEIFGGVLSVQTMHDASGRLQKMVALPEKYVYGWLFQIKSANPDLIEYQKQCCELLYNYFHGTITRHKEMLKTKAERQREMRELSEKLSESPEYQKLMDLKAEEMRIGKALKEMDDTLVKEQLSLFNN